MPSRDRLTAGNLTMPEADIDRRRFTSPAAVCDHDGSLFVPPQQTGLEIALKRENYFFHRGGLRLF